MTPRLLAAAGVAALALSTPVRAAKSEPPGYTPDRAAIAASLPLYVIATNTRVRPQVAYGYLGTPGVAYTGNYPGMSMGQTMGANMAGGLIAGALINGAMYVEAKSAARDYFAPVEAAGCALPVDAPVQAEIAAAANRSPWGSAVRAQLHGFDDGDVADVVPDVAARHVATVSTSLTPDLGGLVTTVQLAGHPSDPARANSARDPAWVDTLIVVSDRAAIPAKTPADTERMLREEAARYAASGAEALIAKVNGEGARASRADRRAAVDAVRLNRRNVREAKEPQWSPRTEALARATLWSQNDCARLRQAIAANAAEVGRLMDALYAQTLPTRLGADETATLPEPDGVRNAVALPGGAYVSRVGGEGVTLGFRHMLLKADD